MISLISFTEPAAKPVDKVEQKAIDGDTKARLKRIVADLKWLAKQGILVRQDAAELEAAYTTVLPEAGPFDPAMCQKSIMIQAALLPEKSA